MPVAPTATPDASMDVQNRGSVQRYVAAAPVQSAAATLLSVCTAPASRRRPTGARAARASAIVCSPQLSAL